MIKKVKQNKFFYLSIFFSILVLLLFGSLSLHDNIWFDEAYQFFLNKHSITDIIGYVAVDFHPPFYASFLKLSTVIFGSTLFVARMVSLLAIILTVWLIFYPIRKLFGEKTSFIMMLFYLTTNVVFYSSIEVRNYSWSPFFLLAACTYLLTWTKEKSKSSFILYTITSILAMYTHYYSMMAVVFMNIVFLIYFIFKKRNLIAKFLFSHLIQFVSFLPWYFILKQQISVLEEGFWISKPKLSVLYETLQYIFNEYLIFHIIIGVALVIGIYGIVKRKEKDKITSAVLVFLSAAVTVYMFYIYSLSHTSIFIPRYIGILSGLLFLSIAIIIGSIKSKYVYGFIVAVIIVPIFILYPREYAMTNDDSIAKLKDKFKDSSETYFIHTDERDLGVFSYYFPNSKHIFYLTENDVLRNAHRVFGDNVIIIRDFKDLNKFSNTYYVIGLKYDKDLERFFLRGKWNDSLYYKLKNEYTDDFDVYKLNR